MTNQKLDRRGQGGQRGLEIVRGRAGERLEMAVRLFHLIDAPLELDQPCLAALRSVRRLEQLDDDAQRFVGATQGKRPQTGAGVKSVAAVDAEHPRRSSRLARSSAGLVFGEPPSQRQPILGHGELAEGSADQIGQLRPEQCPGRW